jgi:hypothetical protein
MNITQLEKEIVNALEINSKVNWDWAELTPSQDYINGERLQHALGWKGSSDFGPKPQASSRKRALKKT